MGGERYDSGTGSIIGFLIVVLAALSVPMFLLIVAIAATH